MEEAFQDLLQEFVDESEPQIESIGAAFLELERHWKLGEAGSDLLAPTKGHLHTLKGNAGMMGIAPMQSVAHALEDLCELVSKRASCQSPETAELLIEGGDLLAEMVRVVVKDKPDPAPAKKFNATVSEYIKQAKERRVRIDRRDGPEWRSGKERRTKPERRKSPSKARSTDVFFGVTSDTVRIDFKRLDTLLEIVGEGVIERSVLSEVSRRLAALPHDVPEMSMLEQATVSLDRVFKNLQETLMEARLLPVSTIFGRFDRLVRDLSHETGKSVRLVKLGEETPIDKRILDRVGDSLVHLVRNAMAHGIDAPDERAQAGKPTEATIRLRAEHRSDRVIVSVEDDGRGIDREKIQERAAELGYDVGKMTEEETSHLIFLPEFSTAKTVSNLAGRGVGLGVVGAAVHGMGGHVGVRSRPGVGTSFELNLPLTLTIVKSLLVEVDREIYAIPLAQIDESVRMEDDVIHDINQMGVMNWRSELIHVGDCGDLMRTDRQKDNKREFCVIVSSGSRRRGILVDRLLGHQEVVVKGLDDILGKGKVSSSASILGDGRIVFIMDVARILEQNFAMGQGEVLSAAEKVT